jgi:hypothetical protein
MRTTSFVFGGSKRWGVISRLDMQGRKRYPLL